MANNINAVILTGNLTRDPELRHTQGGVAVCGMRIAVNGREKVGEQWRDRADFFDVRAWDKLAENCAQYLAKGKPVAISGSLRFEEWEDDKKNKRQRVLVVARDVQFLGSRDGQQREGAEYVPDAQFTVPEGDFSTGKEGGMLAPEEEIPF